jgi:adenine-specific DNA-methyltransferase
MNKRELTPLAKQLRKKPTDAEKKLWAQLSNKQIEGVKFRRQQFIGPYIVDFVSLEKRLIIEIDGGHHNEDEVVEADEKRTTWLKQTGFQVLRFWNNEVLTNIEGVVEKIRITLR